MSTGEHIETRGHIIGFQEEVHKAGQQSKDRFFTWFNSTQDTDSSFIRGHWDFAIHVVFPVAPYLQDPEHKTVLEIGYGGGRLLTAACHYFQYGIGVDIHHESELVATELKKRSVNNFVLHETDGSVFPLNDSSVDLVYSFIVLQHVEKIAILQSNIQETFRVLKPDGLAVLYFGRKATMSSNRNSRLLYWVDCLIENLLLRKGYSEIPARVNEVNLFITQVFARKMLKSIGFQVLSIIPSRKKVPDNFKAYGGQHGFVVRKPAS